MTSDLWALVATIGLAIVQLSISSILAVRQLGPAWAIGPRDEPREVTGRSGRWVRAHRNLLEIFPQFAAALFVVHAAEVNAIPSAIGAWMFFGARVVYVPAYVWGPPGLRSAFWNVAQVGILVILADLWL